MNDNNPYAVLFEPVKIGPVIAPNRFYQTPHATGMGNLRPKSSATLRGIKAEGGWGVVCTEYCSIHPSSDEAPYAYLSLWDDADAEGLRPTVDAIHRHGSLAAIELWHGGSHAPNRMTREPILAPDDSSCVYLTPQQARAMDIEDIEAFRDWHRQAAIRARDAGFDIVYVYAGHDYLPFQFLSPLSNHRSDEYGGKLEGRIRLLRQLIVDTKEAIGDTCGIAVRLAVDELHGERGITSEGDGRAIIEQLAELPDLWDVNLAGSLGNDSRSSRFGAEGFQEDYIRFVKSVTSKPVVSVGRFTSPDTMLGQIRRGVQDFIGAARPSIADPFLPEKIRAGRFDEIRECIGCNICRSANNEGVPLRCTQNPTMGEEWRRGWHPDRIPKAGSQAKYLVVGAGPAGLEASLALAQRGYSVYLADNQDQPGGRLLGETTLPRLASWMRVRDYRQQLLGTMANVDIYQQSQMSADDVLACDVDRVVIATGSHWRLDGIGSMQRQPVNIDTVASVWSPEQVMAGELPTGAVTIYDDEHYYMGSALAEHLRQQGRQVRYITPHHQIAAWSEMTDEQFFVQSHLLQIGVEIECNRSLARVDREQLQTSCIYTGDIQTQDFDQLILVTGRLPDKVLYQDLRARASEIQDVGIKSLQRIGDCLVPSSIADAVYRGHRLAREADTLVSTHAPRELPVSTFED
jgi:dimethylamine/trimethylamine dehydrogenase